MTGMRAHAPLPNTPMTDDELLKEFTRVISADEGVTLECCVIAWPHPSRPESEWVVAKTLSAGATVESIANTRRALLQRRRFFRVCRLCAERKPVGWMIDKGICQSCEEKLGVVF